MEGTAPPLRATEHALADEPGLPQAPLLTAPSTSTAMCPSSSSNDPGGGPLGVDSGPKSSNSESLAAGRGRSATTYGRRITFMATPLQRVVT